MFIADANIVDQYADLQIFDAVFNFWNVRSGIFFGKINLDNPEILRMKNHTLIGKIIANAAYLVFIPEYFCSISAATFCSL